SKHPWPPGWGPPSGPARARPSPRAWGCQASPCPGRPAPPDEAPARPSPSLLPPSSLFSDLYAILAAQDAQARGEEGRREEGPTPSDPKDGPGRLARLAGRPPRPGPGWAGRGGP